MFTFKNDNHIWNMIRTSVKRHETNAHRFHRRGKINPENRVPTNLTLNEVILLILDHLELEVVDCENIPAKLVKKT